MKLYGFRWGFYPLALQKFAFSLRSHRVHALCLCKFIIGMDACECTNESDSDVPLCWLNKGPFEWVRET